MNTSKEMTDIMRINQSILVVLELLINYKFSRDVVWN